MNMPIQAELPKNLLTQAQELVQAGWATDLLADALRRYLESHSVTLADKFIREDIQWRLNGKE